MDHSVGNKRVHQFIRALFLPGLWIILGTSALRRGRSLTLARRRVPRGERAP